MPHVLSLACAGVAPFHRRLASTSEASRVSVACASGAVLNGRRGQHPAWEHVVSCAGSSRFQLGKMQTSGATACGPSVAAKVHDSRGRSLDCSRGAGSCERCIVKCVLRNHCDAARRTAPQQPNCILAARGEPRQKKVLADKFANLGESPTWTKETFDFVIAKFIRVTASAVSPYCWASCCHGNPKHFAMAVRAEIRRLVRCQLHATMAIAS